MGKTKKRALRLRFDRRLRLQFHASRITSEVGLPVCRELDDALGLKEVKPRLQETLDGPNLEPQHAARFPGGSHQSCNDHLKKPAENVEDY